MTTTCSKHRSRGDPERPEILWALTVPFGKVGLILCDAGHYVRVKGPAVPLVFLVDFLEGIVPTA